MKATNQVVIIIMILNTWLGLAVNENFGLIICLDNAKYLNFQDGYELSSEFKANTE